MPSRTPFSLKPCGGTTVLPISAVWHRRPPALYELRDGKPSLVAYDLDANGLFVVRRLLSNGWLQIGDKKAKWRVVSDEQ